MDYGSMEGLIAPAAFSLVMAGALGYGWRAWRQAYLAWWAAFWGLYALVWPALSGVYAMGGPLAGLGPSALHTGVSLAAYSARACAALGVVAYMGWRWPTRRQLEAVALLVVGLVLGGALVRRGIAHGQLPELVLLPFKTYFGGGLLSLALGIGVLRRRADAATQHQWLLGMALLASAGSDLWDVGLDVLAAPAWLSGPAQLRLSVLATSICDSLFAAGMLIAAIGTERARAERAAAELQARQAVYEQAQRLEAIGQLAGGVAHDFNNLLTAVGASLSFVREQLPPGDPALEDVAVAKQATERAAELTRQLLTFARKQVVRPELLDLNDCVLRVEPLLRSLSGEERVRKVRLAGRVWPVRIDPMQLERLLVNLVANARDATPPGGTITIETANVALGDESRLAEEMGAPAGHWVRLAVSDDGKGMDSATRARIFEPFFTTKGLGAGTGLGLATVHGIVTQAGGTIGVSSQPGRGSRFAVLLPRAAGELARTPDLTPVPIGQRGTETILLAEDDAQVRALAARALRARGYAVTVADDGREALALALDGGLPRLGLLVTDVAMPALGGPALAAELLRHRPDLPVLFMTGNAPGDLDAGLPAGALVDLLPKPFTPEDLGGRVRTLIDRAARRALAKDVAAAPTE